MYKNKRGFAITFSWMFSLVAGALIFLFLVYFAMQHTDLFGQRSNVLIREQFDNAFGSLKSTDITTHIELDERINLRFECFEENIRFGVERGDRKEIPGNIIAAPEELSGFNFSIKTKSLIKPFKIASFIYVDSDEEPRQDDEDPLTMAENYASDNYEECIVPMIEERLRLVKEVYVKKADNLVVYNSEERPCNYFLLRDGISKLTYNDVLQDSSRVDGLIRENENLVREGCPALF